MHNQDFITLEIPGVKEIDILSGIMTLAEFPEGSPFRRTGSYWPEINKHTLLAWYVTDLNEEFMLRESDIAVSRVHERKPNQSMFKPTDKYRVIVSEKVNPKIFEMLEERIREEYRKTS